MRNGVNQHDDDFIHAGRILIGLIPVTTFTAEFVDDQQIACGRFVFAKLIKEELAADTAFIMLFHPAVTGSGLRLRYIDK